MSSSNNTTAGGGVGHKFPPTPVGWLKRDLLLYSNSIGTCSDELHFLYELQSNFQALPTYPVILSEFVAYYRHLLTMFERKATYPHLCKRFQGSGLRGRLVYIASVPRIRSRRPPLDPAAFVDGERHIKILKPIPASTTPGHFELHGECLAIYDEGDAGTVLAVQHRGSLRGARARPIREWNARPLRSGKETGGGCIVPRPADTHHRPE